VQGDEIGANDLDVALGGVEVGTDMLHGPIIAPGEIRVSAVINSAQTE
jgi:hypothetical protein